MKIATTRFGEITIADDKIIEMKGEILGFEHLKKFIMLVHDEKTPFLWFQSVEDGATAFVVVNPQLIKADYEPVVSDEDAAGLEIKEGADVVLMSIVTIRSNPLAVTANLRAPLVINARKMLAKQIVLDDPDLPIRYDIAGNRKNMPEAISEDAVPGRIDKLSSPALP